MNPPPREEERPPSPRVLRDLEENAYPLEEIPAISGAATGARGKAPFFLNLQQRKEKRRRDRVTRKKKNPALEDDVENPYPPVENPAISGAASGGAHGKAPFFLNLQQRRAKRRRAARKKMNPALVHDVENPYPLIENPAIPGAASGANGKGRFSLTVISSQGRAKRRGAARRKKNPALEQENPAISEATSGAHGNGHFLLNSGQRGTKRRAARKKENPALVHDVEMSFENNPAASHTTDNVTPGAVQVQGFMSSLHGVEDTNDGDLQVGTCSGTDIALGAEDDARHAQTLSSLIVQAHLVQDDQVIPDFLEEHVERRIQDGIELRIQAHTRHATVAEAVVSGPNNTSARVDGPDSNYPKDALHHTVCGLRPKSFCVLTFVGMVLVAAIVTGVVIALGKPGKDFAGPSLDSELSTQSPVMQRIEDELEPWIIRSDEDRALFQDPSSPQSRALDWLSGDNITLSRDRLPNVVLERYVLAVFYYSTDGPNWSILKDFEILTDRDVCNWNSGNVGFFCGRDANVEVISLEGKGLSGTIPWELSLLFNLTMLTVSNNFLHGSIPTEIGQLTLLQSIEAYNNNLEGPIPTETGQLTDLVNFSVNNNGLNGSLPTELGQLTALSSFSCIRNSISGTLPTELGQWSTLELLRTFANAFTGKLPTELGKLTGLTSLEMDDNSLTGTLPTELGQMTALEIFGLSNNSFTGTLPTELGQMTALEECYMYNNMFHGTLPTDLGILAGITIMRVENNTLTGTIPTELGMLAGITSLAVYNNSLTGTLPTELGMLAGIAFLSLSGNSLTGTLPTELGQMTGLETFGVYNNKLTGTLPTSLGNLIKLEELRIHSNIFTGSVPTVLSELKNLKKFSFHKNNFTGSVNDTFCAAAMQRSLLQGDCMVTNGKIEIVCDCCTTCCNADGEDCQETNTSDNIM